MRPMVEPIVITREALYARVWETPMRHLAKEFGLSDVGLRKCCERHSIPTPWAGYWAKLTAGKGPRKLLLKPLKDPSLATIRIFPTPPTADKSKAPLADQFFDPEIGRLAVLEGQRSNWRPKSLRDLHPAVERTHLSLNQLREHRTTYRDPRIKATQYKGHWCFESRIAKASAIRTVLLLQAIVKGCEERGYSIRDRGQERDQWSIEAIGYRFKLSIIERMKRVPRDASKSSSNFDRYEYHPTGRIDVVVEAVGFYAMEVIHSGKKPVEEKLPEIFYAILRLADKGSLERAEEQQRLAVRAAQDLRRCEEAERLRLDEEKRKQEESRVQDLLNEAHRWGQANQLRAYLAEMRALLSKRP